MAAWVSRAAELGRPVRVSISEQMPWMRAFLLPLLQAVRATHNPKLCMAHSHKPKLCMAHSHDPKNFHGHTHFHIHVVTLSLHIHMVTLSLLHSRGRTLARSLIL